MKNKLLLNIDKIHTTELGSKRIKKNLGLDVDDVVKYCKNIILNKDCNIKKVGKNFYCEKDNVIIAINACSYTIITAHLKKE